MSIFVGSDVARDLELRCDVCIVGSGAGAAPLAARLVEAGHRVILLEDGGFHPSRSFDLREGTMFPRLYQEGGGRKTADGAISVLQGRAVGGTTVVNWTTCFRTPESVMAYWREQHGVAGLSHQALVPHWQWIEERLHIQQVSLSQINANNRVLWQGAENLGWRKQLLQRNVKHCAQTGYCGVGCVIDAKQSMLVTLLPDALRSGAQLYANAWVERVETRGRRAHKVVARVRDPQTDQLSGRRIEVEARVVVLAAGGINTPAILLRSDLNDNGRVGRRTFLHPTVAAVGLHDFAIRGFEGAPQSVACEEFVSREEGMGFILEAAPVFPMTYASGGYLYGAEQQALADQMERASITIALLHDGFDASDPDEGGTVSLHDDGSPKLDYAWSPRLEEGLRSAVMRCAEAQLAGGAREVWTLHAHRPLRLRGDADLQQLKQAAWGPNQHAVFSAHVMGGCAMGTDPRTSVVDSRSLRHHELDNLFVVDGSVYPTSLTVNPQLSIYGLSRWAADAIAATL